MTTPRTLPLLFSILALAGTCAQAAPVFEQSTVSAAVSTGWTSQLGTGQGGYQTFEDFTLSHDAAINKVTWQGTYLTADAGGLQGAAPNTLGWTVEFWTGNAAGPTTRQFSRSYTAADAHPTLDRQAAFGNTTINVYDFELDLGTEFDADAGELYWFSVRSDSNSFSPFFSWTNADGPGNSYQRMFDGGGQVLANFVRGGDRTFALHAVPEPASLALAMSALLMASAVAARRRTGARAAGLSQ